MWKADKEVDALYVSLFRELLTYSMEDPGTISMCIHHLFCAKNIERIGDHATNIAEAVHYMVEGQAIAGERPKGDYRATSARRSNMRIRCRLSRRRAARTVRGTDIIAEI